ncbi:MAG: L,D-transpeptidase family protein [Nitrosomonas sp.]|nr:MAG: L,D-transpeptidase family protein [Nitrosomonas sp.]
MKRYSISSFAVIYRIICCGMLLLCPTFVTAAAGETGTLRKQLEQPSAFSLADAELEALRRFYAARHYQPVWMVAQSETALLETALGIIARADEEGLDSGDYRLPLLRQLRAQAVESAFGANELEIRVSHAMLRLARDMASGRLSVKAADPDWHIAQPKFDAVVFLHEAIQAGRLSQALAGLPPQQPSYQRLKQTLARYRKLSDAGANWLQIPSVPSIHPGDISPVIPLIRERIVQAYTADGTAAFAISADQNRRYDDALVAAIEAFQAQHGLNTDGVIGKNTIKALNIPLDWKIRQLRINMERLRWLPRDLGQRYLLVNTTGFNLAAIENDQPVLAMRIIVGRDYRSTPSFSSAVSHLVINPYWNVPASIARHDLLPKQQQDSGFFASSGFEVYPGHDRQVEPIDPDSIDWRSYGKSFPFFLRQQPGPRNALGKVKFMFPNSFSIYLHDTPSKSLFRRDMRTFSSGCIRLEKPMELAGFSLNQQNLLDKFNAYLEDDRTVTMHLPKPLPIYLVYITAWVDGAHDGVRFYPDIYRRDFNALRHARW